MMNAGASRCGRAAFDEQHAARADILPDGQLSIGSQAAATESQGTSPCFHFIHYPTQQVYQASRNLVLTLTDYSS